jgi:hypothetical protein
MRYFCSSDTGEKNEIYSETVYQPYKDLNTACDSHRKEVMYILIDSGVYIVNSCLI